MRLNIQKQKALALKSHSYGKFLSQEETRASRNNTADPRRASLTAKDNRASADW